MATAQQNCTVKLIRDTDAESPRSWDNLGTMACAHKRYNLGDEDGTREALQIIYKHLSDKQLDEMGFDDGELPDIQAALEKTGQVIMLPLYLYDHSGITMSTSSFSCRWDSGQVGFIYVSKAKVRQEYGWKLLTKERIAKIEAILKSEVEVYDQYLTGDIWGFEVTEDDQEDSCWGFFGSDPLKNGILAHLSERAAELVKAGQYQVCD